MAPAVLPPDPFEEALQALEPSAALTVDTMATLMRAQYASLVGYYEKALSVKDREISMLKARTSFLEDKVDSLEQYSRRQSVRVSGVPEPEGPGATREDTESVVMEVIRDNLKTPLLPDDIERAHRTGRPTPGRPRDILVKFTSHNDKSAVMKARKNLKSTNIYINEDLTRTRQNVAYHARQLKKKQAIQDTWTRDGIIMVRTFANTVVRVATMDELAKVN